MPLWLFQPVLFFVFLYILLKKFKRQNEPPGPIKWPLIGNVFELCWADSSYPHLAFQKLADKYGNVMSLNLGVHKMVMLSSFEIIREAMKRDELATKYQFPFVLERGYGKSLGIIHGNGESWSVIRRFTVASLREYGFAKKSSMEVAMKSELRELLESMKKEVRQNNGTLTFDNYFSISIVNLLWTSVTGQRFSATDQKARLMIELNTEYTQHASIDRLSVLLPFLRHIFPGLTGFTQQKNCIRRLQDFMKEIIKEARKDQLPEGQPKSFIDSFLCQIEKKVHPAFTEQQLIVVLMDLFLGGSETTSNMLSFAILYMTLHPEVQRKVQTEIDDMDSDEFLSLDDVKKMPYTQATILEIFRLALVIPIPFGRVALSDTNINGYVIPKGTLIAYNLNSIQMDPIFWEDPEIFRPERFLSPNMTIMNDERVPLFGFGKRICPGETLARNAFFMYFVSILRNFEFSVLTDQPLPSVAPRPNSNVQTPKPYSVFAEERKR